MMKLRKENYHFVSNYKPRHKMLSKLMAFTLGLAMIFLSAAGIVYFTLMSNFMNGVSTVITG